ncbi:D-lactaldehyde dehydrogenase [Cyathus striatus]|nr:D-lactaldehyde dehydrogenase [Cyathus striatus]
MPAIPTESKVLVTGANGYIALWVVHLLLKKGYSVRVQVRTLDKGDYLRKLFSQYEAKLEIAIVDDITKEGAFDEAVRGIDAIAHMASPLPQDDPDLEPDVYIVPAVKGTVGLLDSAKKQGKSVKRVVYTSSVAAVLSPTLNDADEFNIYSPDDWNTESTELVKTEGKKASTNDKYRASKTLAERAAWNFVATFKSYITFDLVALHPPLVLGPSLQDIQTPDAFTSSMKTFYSVVLNPNSQLKESTLRTSSCWVDVRDIAEAHIQALERSEAGGQRFLVNAGAFTWQEWLNLANTIAKRPLQKGIPGLERKYKFDFDSEKTTRVLGIEFKSKEETLRDILEEVEKKDW